jgi:hypothetical protein
MSNYTELGSQQSEPSVGKFRLKDSTPEHVIEAAKELLFRKRLKGSLTEYARLMGFEPAKHH